MGVFCTCGRISVKRLCPPVGAGQEVAATSLPSYFPATRSRGGRGLLYSEAGKSGIARYNNGYQQGQTMNRKRVTIFAAAVMLCAAAMLCTAALPLASPLHGAVRLTSPLTRLTEELTAQGIPPSAKDFQMSGTTLVKYTGAGGNVTIPQGVTAIGVSAFYGSGLSGVTIPDSVTSIGLAAFSHCSGLAAVTIPGGVTSIEPAAFSHCSGLAAVTMPDGVTGIGQYAFFGCRGLTGITIPPGVRNIGDNAFDNCRGITGAAIPRGVTRIGNNVFANCVSLAAVTIPDGVTGIGKAAFLNCSALTAVTIPDSVTAIGEDAFKGCSGLTGVTLPANARFTVIAGGTFSGCVSLSGVTIGNGVKTIGDGAFSRTGLTGVVIPAGVAGISRYAFSGCDSLTSVTFQGKIAPANLHNGAFENMGDLRARYLAGGPGTYTRPNGGFGGTWAKQ